MVCEICKKEANELINVGVDIGFHLGDYAQKEPIKYKVKPECICVFSIYLCRDCKRKIEQNGYFNINVVPELKGLLKGALIKNMIIEGLKE